ncbi:glycosyltransferase family 1 protein [Chaetomium strumarium]|uniref:Glycosyltransferase family 1 protein n=1 Tax=Chaetomium strumarium TaxID=1170767 RepID=A0AAJ0LYU5_9PEZI|nr:glycosyltransferase family 1 protein [Chaetomium strumarium]
MKKVLLATNSEYGQANVFLAAGHALQALDPDVRIHFASYQQIAKDVATASAYSVHCSQGGGAQPWTFHELDGPSFEKAVEGREKTGNRVPIGALITKPPGFFNNIELFRRLPSLLLPWDGAETVQAIQSFNRIVDAVQPDIVVIDSLFSPVLTACRHRGLRHVILSPNTLKDFGAALQPWGALLWKFPVMSTGFPFPVPPRYIPANIFYCLCIIYYTLTDTARRATAAHVKRETGADLITFEDLMMRPLPGQKILVANRPEIEFPMVVPQHLTPCGPVIRPAPSVAEVDPELDAWLRRGPTVFISLGTHRFMDEEEAVEMATVVRQLLDADDERENGGGVGGISGRLQVLWKLKKVKTDQDYGTLKQYVGKDFGTEKGGRIHGILGDALDSDRVRIVDWVKPQPSAVLQTGQVVCSVNHGGANSFNDALTSGVPQVPLPAWLDCYDFASRAEVLGIGRCGSRKSAPKCTARELGPIVVDVVFGPNAQSMRTKAKELAALCNKTPGATVAAAAILDEIDNKKGK